MYKILFIFLIIFSFVHKYSYANESIAFINIDKVINQSNYGKKVYSKIDNDFKKEEKKLLKIEKNLISKEQDILKQKNILSEDELNNRISQISDNKIKRRGYNKLYMDEVTQANEGVDFKFLK